MERRGTGKAPPVPKTYKMPTMADDGLDYHAKPAAIVQAPALDADAIFNSVLDCFPEKSKYDIDVKLRASVRSSATHWTWKMTPRAWAGTT